MRSWKLHVRFYSPCVFYHRPLLDALLSYALERRHQPYRCMYIAPKWRNRDPVGIPHLQDVVQCFDDIPLTTQMRAVGPELPYLDSWKKRFHSKDFRLIRWGRGSHKINTASGKYRSYNMPLPAKTINAAWFGFVGDGPAVLDLMRSHLFAIGKKASDGFGIVDEYRLEEADLDAVDILALRPVPLRVIAQKNLPLSGEAKQVAYKPPYWDNCNVEACVCPAL